MTFATFQHIALSLVGAVLASSLFVSAATPVVPIF